MTILELLQLAFGIYSTNFVATYAIKCHVINKNINEITKIAKAKGIPDHIIEHITNSLDKKPENKDYIPFLNLYFAIMSWLNRKNDIKELKYNVEHYSDRDTYILDCEDTEATIKAEYREYFVGYFENSTPIVIYFRYNGDDDIVFGECAKTFEAYDNDTKCNILLHILYEIYIGSKEYIACASIDEVFTEIMVNNLKSIFEENKHEYIISTEEKKLVRKKIK